MTNTKKVAVLLVLSAFLGAVLSLAGYKYLIDNKTYQSIEERQNARFSNYAADSSFVVPEGMNFMSAASIVRPAVVHIKTYYEVNTAQQIRPQSPFDDLFRDYFGDKYGGDGGMQEMPPQQAAGSGVILTDDGYIATNNHVIDKADKIEVALNDKRSFIATVIGVDPTTDLALLKIDAKGLPFVKYGNSDKVNIGEWVLACGNPFNLTSTVTAGIVSAKARNINILKDKDNMAVESFIQTDAAVNPGNSGGALVNLRGELIGINTAIATPTGSYAGYSFAVPVTMVKKVMEDLYKHGYVQRALLGVTILDLSSEVAKEKGITQIKGVYISGVNEGGSAHQAGLKAGDIITSIDGVEVSSASELQEQVARHRPGEKIVVGYVRDGKSGKAEATLRNKMGDTGIVHKEDVPMRTVMGAQLKEATSQELSKLKIEKGVKVMKISEGKFKTAGIREGFIITSIDKRKVGNANEVELILQDSRGSGVLVEGMYSDGKKQFFAIEN